MLSKELVQKIKDIIKWDNKFEGAGEVEILDLILNSILELNQNLEVHEHNINVIGKVVADKVPNSGLR